MMAELQLTVEDREWLKAMDRACAVQPMVSAKQYQAAVDARDLMVRRNMVLVANQRRLWARYRRQRAWLLVWWRLAMAHGVGFWLLMEKLWGR